MTNLAEITLYSADDVSRFLGIAKPSVNKLCRERVLTAKKVGNEWKVTKEALEKYLKIKK